MAAARSVAYLCSTTSAFRITARRAERSHGSIAGDAILAHEPADVVVKVAPTTEERKFCGQMLTYQKRKQIGDCQLLSSVSCGNSFIGLRNRKANQSTRRDVFCPHLRADSA